MPSSEHFSLEIIENSFLLSEYAPEEEEDSEHSSRGLDRVSFVQATPGSEFYVKITYHGTEKISSEHAYRLKLYIDGELARGKSFYQPQHTQVTIKEILVEGDRVQKFVFVQRIVLMDARMEV
jgi:hypothetical protein